MQYIDELIQTSLNSSPTSQSICDTPYWAEQDANFNLLGIINSSGALAERYEFGAYGQRTPYISAGSNDTFCTAATTASTRFNASGTAEPWGLCEVGHQGLMHDEECGLIYNRARYVQSQLGRFIQRDPIGYINGMALYPYEKGNPLLFCDSAGTTVHSCSVVAGSTVTQVGWTYLGVDPDPTTVQGELGPVPGGAVATAMAIYRQQVYQLMVCCDACGKSFYHWELGATIGTATAGGDPQENFPVVTATGPLPIPIGGGQVIDLGPLFPGNKTWARWIGGINPVWQNHPASPGTVGPAPTWTNPIAITGNTYTMGAATCGTPPYPAPPAPKFPN